MTDDLLVLALGAAAAPAWVGPALIATGVAVVAWLVVTGRRHVRPHVRAHERCVCGVEQGGRSR